MALFTNPRRKLARDTAQHLISGHASLLAYWALRHAGVWAALATKEGLAPAAFAEQTNMAPEVLEPLLDYLVRHGLLASHEGIYRLSPTGEALADFEDGVLEHVWAHESVLQTLERLLARLRVNTVTVKHDALAAGQAARYVADVYPALARAAEKLGVTHVLDLACGTGELLCMLAEHSKRIVGVGVGADGMLVRQANDLITRRGLEKRLIAVPAGVVEVCTDTRATFDRTGVTTQLWDRLDCLVGCGVLTALLPQGQGHVADILRHIPQAFPGAAILIAEPCAGPAWDKNYCAPEMELLLRLGRGALLTEKEWREILAGAGLEVTEVHGLATEGLSLFVCRTPQRAKAATPVRIRHPATPA